MGFDTNYSEIDESNKESIVSDYSESSGQNQPLNNSLLSKNTSLDVNFVF